MKRKQFLGYTVVLLILAAAAGCKSTGTVASSAQFRIMNASVEQPSLTALLNTVTAAADLAYPTAIAYIPEAPGAYTLHVEPSGTTSTLINQPVVFQQGTYYTFIAAEAAFASPALTGILLTDDNSAPSSGQMKLRIVNASPDIGDVDVYVVAPGSSIQNASPTVSSVPFKSATSYQPLAAGSYEVYFTAAGQKTVLIDSGKLTFSDGQIRTLVALDSAGGYTSSLLADMK